jgi:opacity protein-like surface antigen
LTSFTAPALAVLLVLSAGIAIAESDVSGALSVLRDRDFSLAGADAEKTAASARRRGVLVPTPWGEVEATIVSTPVDRMLRVPLTPAPDAAQEPLVQPYVAAGSRRDLDADLALDPTRPATGSDAAAGLKAGAGVSVRLDPNVEIFGEYQFMRLRGAEGRGTSGSLGPTLDTSGFSLGLSIRY